MLENLKLIYRVLEINVGNVYFFNFLPGDKILHFSFILIIGLFLSLFSFLLIKIINYKFIIFILIFISIGKEIYDYLFRTSGFSLTDIVSDIIGIIVLVILLKLGKLLKSFYQK